MVAIAQLVEPWIVIPVVAGSSPVSHPTNLGNFGFLFWFNSEQNISRWIAQLGSASGLGPEGRGFESLFTDHYLVYGYISSGEHKNLMVAIAQLVEPRIVIPVVASSSLVSRPILLYYCIGV